MSGRVRLEFFGRMRSITGGPFDDWRPPAIGLCLEAGSAMAGRATVLLPVADFGAPSAAAFAEGLVALLRAMRAAPERPVHVGCRAGLGRTGMAIAALAKLAGEADPIGWTRQHYDARAVETAGQERAVLDLDIAAIWRGLDEDGAAAALATRRGGGKRADAGGEGMMRLGRRSVLALAGAGAGAAMLGARPARAAGKLTLGMLHTLSPAPFYLAQERGYFREAGVEVAFRFFQAAQPISAAAVAGDIDLGVTALTGGFFALAGKGELKVIGGALREKKGYHLSAVLASKQAYAAGLDSLRKLGGHSFGITQYGSSFHYMIGQLAATEGFDLKSMKLRPLQGVANMVAAVRSGQIDATIAIASMALPAQASGDAKIIGWISDVMPSYQITALFGSGAALKAHPAEVRAFCRGYQRGIADFRAAFLNLGADHKPIYTAATDQAIADLTKYVFTGDPKAAAKIKAGVGWYDASGALDVADVRRQLAWYEAQGMVKGKVDPDAIIDTGFMPRL